MTRSRAARAALFALALLVLAPLVHSRVFEAGNDASRFAQIESLVDFGEGSIDASRYSWTVDRVTIGGREYSNKPPLLSLIGAATYAAIERLTGWSFARNEGGVVYLLTFLLAAVPAAWLVALFHGTMRRFWGTPADGAAQLAQGMTRPAPGAIALATAALLAGTILTSFATTLNNHTIAAALLFAACDASWSGRAAAAGAWLAALFGIDTVPALLFAPALAIILRDTAGLRSLRRFGAALLAGVVAFVAANLYVLGSPWPPKMVPGAADFSSQMGPSVAGVLLPSSWSYPLSALFGWHGFFTVSPVLLFGAAGLVLAARSSRPLPRRITIPIGVSCAAMIAGHALFVGSFGGWSYGFRYLIPIIPLLLFFLPAALEAAGAVAFVPVLLLSCFFALLGAYHPWPPGDEPGTGKHPIASVVTNPVGANLAAWLRQHSPGGPLTEPAERQFISRDPEARERYLALFYRSKGDLTMARRIAPPPSE